MPYTQFPPTYRGVVIDNMMISNTVIRQFQLRLFRYKCWLLTFFNLRYRTCAIEEDWQGMFSISRSPSLVPAKLAPLNGRTLKSQQIYISSTVVIATLSIRLQKGNFNGYLACDTKTSSVILNLMRDISLSE